MNPAPALRNRLRRFLPPLLLLAAAATLVYWPRPPTRSLSDSNPARIDTLFDRYRRSFPDVPSLSPDEYLALRERENVVLVDVRTPEEREISMIPGAVTVDEFEARKSRYSDHAIVAYCTVGYRSGIYAKELRGEDFRSFNVRGGILAWTHAGQPLNSEQGPTKRVHTYGPKWNLLPEGYEAVW